MDAIETRCPHCLALFRLPPNQFGTLVRCGRCRQTFTPAALSPPPLPPEPPPLPVPQPRPTLARAVARPSRAAPAPRPVRARERRERPDRDDRPRRDAGGANLAVVLVLVGVFAVLALAAVGGIAYFLFAGGDVQHAATDSKRVEPAASPETEAARPAERAEPPDRDEKGNPVSDTPRTRPVRAATVGVWAPGQTSLGSGFVAGPPGHVVTTARQVGHGPGGSRPLAVEVTLRSGLDQRTQSGRVVKADAAADLALVKLDDPSPPAPVKIGRTGSVLAGQTAQLFGYKHQQRLDKGASITNVRIARIDRAAGEIALHDVTLDPGLTGGPLVSYDGLVVGMCSLEPGRGQPRIIPGEQLAKFLGVEPVDSPFAKPPSSSSPPSAPPSPPVAAWPAGTAPPITPAPLTADRTEVRLPAAAAEACVGGGGRFLILHLASARQLAVFDVNQARVVKLVPVPAGGVKFAAGLDKLVVISATNRTVTRYDLRTFEPEATAPLPGQGQVLQAVMGSASSGPVLLLPGPGRPAGSAQVQFLDLNSLAPVEFTRPGTPGPLTLGFGENDVVHFRASPDGSVFVVWNTSVNEDMQTLTLSGGKVIVRSGEMAGIANPTGDGLMVCGAGVYTTDCKPAVGDRAEPRYRLRVPARTGRFYLTCPGGGGAQVNTGRGDEGKPTDVYMIGNPRPIATLPDVELPASNESWARDDFNQDKRVHFVPEAKLIAVLPASSDRLVLHRFDPVAHLEAAGADYLYVTSRPPAALPGGKFYYQVTAKSRRGGVKYKLHAGPPGMAVSAEGQVTWDVPAQLDPVTATVSVTDAGGQEVFHTFALAGPVGGAVAAKPPEKTPRVRPRPPQPATPTPPQPVQPAPPEPVQPAAPAPAPDAATVRLPAAADDVCVGGGGRFLLFRLPKTRQVAVLDATAGKVVRYLPLAEDNALIAAGTSKLYVLNPTANVIQRWSLSTFEKETTVASPVGGAPKQLLMGHATDGPLYVGGPGVTAKNYALLDPKTFREVEVKVEGNRGGPAVGDRYPHLVRVSADGRVYAWWTPHLSPMGLNSMVVNRQTARSYNEHTTVGSILPGPDGTLFTAGGLYTSDLKPIGDRKGYQYWHLPPVPAAEGPWYLEFAKNDLPGRDEGKPPKVALKMVGDERPIVPLPELPGLATPGGPFNATQTGGGLPFYDRVHLLPSAGVLAVVAHTGDTVYLHKFDLADQLKRSGIDYLVVTSRPPPAAGRGTKFSYTPTVLSRRGGVKLKLEAGPEGMAVSGTAVTWDVPEDFAETEANVILLVTDSTGQEVFHTFRLAVRDKREVSAAAAPRPADPGPAAPPTKVPETDARPYEQAARASPVKPCPLKADVEERPLPSAAGPLTAVGGGGRYLIFHLPKERQLAVFDANEGKVAKFLPVPDDRPLFTAGRSVLVVYAPSVNAFIRYRLPTLEKEATVVSPVNGPKSIGMGPASDGPLYVLGPDIPGGCEFMPLDPRTLRPAGEKVKVGGSGAGQFTDRHPRLFVSEDGRLVGGASGALVRSWSGYVKPGLPEFEYPVPTPDGRSFVVTGRVYTSEGQSVGEPVGGHGSMVWHVPAVHGPYYVSINQQPDAPGEGRGHVRLAVHPSGERRALFTLPRLAATKTLEDWTNGVPAFEQYVHYVPDARLLVVLPKARDRLILHRVDGDELMAKAGVDYLMVTSQPPLTAAPGETFRYTPAVRSKKGKARLRLERGPDDMTLADGTLTWKVPADAPDPVTVVLAVTDASGQEVFHTFTLTVRAKD